MAFSLLPSKPHCVDCGRFVPIAWRQRWPKADLVCTRCIEEGAWVDTDYDDQEEIYGILITPTPPPAEAANP